MLVRRFLASPISLPRRWPFYGTTASATGTVGWSPVSCQRCSPASASLASPLPCLTGLARAMRYSTAGSAEIEGLLAPRLGEQARDGLALLRRLEACAHAWRGRLGGLTARSRAGQAAGVFLVWPTLTRAQLAAALGTTQAGAGKILEVLVLRGIVERVMFGGAAYFVAHESLGEFKIAARQGPQVQMPGMSAVFAELDASMAVLDLLAIEFEDGAL